MNIIILPTAYPNVYDKNSAIFIHEQAIALSLQPSLNVKVLGAIPISFKDIFKKKLFKFGFSKQIINNLEIKLFLFPSIPKLRGFNNYIQYKLNQYLLNKVISKINVNIIHVHNVVVANAAFWSYEKFNIPYCITEHSSGYTSGLIGEKDILNYKKLYKYSKYNIAVGESFCMQLESIFDLNFHYIPNIVDTNFFKPIEKERNARFTFINVANLTKNKNQKLLLESFSEISKEGLDVKLVILGDGEEYNFLRKYILDLEISDKIILYGQADRIEVLKEMQKAHCFVLTSNYETFGVVLIEAMSCGLPLISTKCGGPESIVVNNELGILVEKKDKNSLKKALLDMYNNKYSSTSIRKYALDNFSQNIVVNQLSNIYNMIEKKG